MWTTRRRSIRRARFLTTQIRGLDAAFGPRASMGQVSFTNLIVSILFSCIHQLGTDSAGAHLHGFGFKKHMVGRHLVLPLQGDERLRQVMSVPCCVQRGLQRKLDQKIAGAETDDRLLFLCKGDWLKEGADRADERADLEAREPLIRDRLRNVCFVR